MSEVRLGIVGVGGIGNHHIGYLLEGKVPGTRIGAICDIDPEALAKTRARIDGATGGSVACFDNSDALINSGEVDAIIIGTPHYDHPVIAISALKKGLHVLSEKPAGVYTQQVREMNEAAAKSGKVFGIMFQMRTKPVYAKLKELVESGELGKITRNNWVVTCWFRSQSYYNSGGWRATWAGEGGGVLLNQCPHNLDIWQWTVGVPKRVFAMCGFGKYHDIEVEDDVTAMVEYEDGSTGVFVTTTGEAPGSDRFEVVGDRAKAVVEDGVLSVWRNRVPTSEFNRDYKGGFGSPETWKCEVPVKKSDEGHYVITRNFVKAIKEGTPLIAPGEEGIRSLEISDAMLLSAWTGQWVDVPVDEKKFRAMLEEKAAKSRFVKKTAKIEQVDMKASFKA